MAKKNKQKNQSNNNSATTQKTKITEIAKPTIIVGSDEEKVTLEEAMNVVNKYCDAKKEEADAYYEKKTNEADVLKEKMEDEIQRAVDNAVEKKQREMKNQIETAKQEAEEIIKNANQTAKKTKETLDNRQKELVKSEEEYTKKLAELEASKENYKQEVLSGIQNELSTITFKKDELQRELDSIKEELRKKNNDIKSLEEDKAFYEEELSANDVKKSEILSFKTKIKGLESDLVTLNSLYSDLQEKNNCLTKQILLYGVDPSKAIKENAELTKRIAELETDLASCPPQEELVKLRENNVKFEEVYNRLEILKQENFALKSENEEVKVNKDEIESYRKFIKILELQKAELQREFNKNIELYNNSTEKIFANLSLIDSEPCKEYPSIVRSRGITLKMLCDSFRGYLANRSDNPLYYEEKAIRTFIAGFASSRLMILEGLSGTGKSSLPRAFADFMGSNTIEVPVQSSWKDRNDLLGFYNDFKKQYKETEFLKALYKATHDPNNIYVIVLDEMNLSRIEYYFADLLSVLEKPNVEDWKIELISDFASISKNSNVWPKLIHEGKFQISDNTWFVGTANKDDSTFIITDKVYDRSVVLNFEKKGELENIAKANPIQMNNEDFLALLSRSQKFSEKKNEERYKEMLKCLDDYVKEFFQITFGNRIANQLDKFVPVYIACGGTVDEAIDIMFSRKVLRKLEGLYDEKTKECLDIFKDEIKNHKYDMPITIKTIDRMMEKI